MRGSGRRSNCPGCPSGRANRAQPVRTRVARSVGECYKHTQKPIELATSRRPARTCATAHRTRSGAERRSAVL
ncbi:unnamed protein product [Parajaminaea phylloscopi]